MRKHRLTDSQRQVLAVLRPGGLLTLDQISKATDLPRLRARRAVSALRRAGLISPGVGIGSGRYRIASTGLASAVIA